MSKTLESRLHALFFRSSALLLFFTAAAKLYSATGSALVLARRDEILFITNRWLMVVVAVVETGVACYLIRARWDSLRALALIWLSGNFVLYRSAYTALGLGPCPCLGTLGHNLLVSHATLHAVHPRSAQYIRMPKNQFLINFAQNLLNGRRVGIIHAEELGAFYGELFGAVRTLYFEPFDGG